MYQICDEWTHRLTDISYTFFKLETMTLVTLYPNLQKIFRNTLYHQTSDKLRCSPQQQDFLTFSWFWKKKSKISWLFPEMPDFLKKRVTLPDFPDLPDSVGTLQDTNLHFMQKNISLQREFSLGLLRKISMWKKSLNFQPFQPRIGNI